MDYTHINTVTSQSGWQRQVVMWRCHWRLVLFHLKMV